MMAWRVRPCPVGPFDGEDEGEAELGVVVRIQLVQRGEFLRTAKVQAGLGLFIGRFGRELAGDGGLARQFRVGADQAQLFIQRGALTTDCKACFSAVTLAKGRRAAARSGIHGECS
jgi:hypothetical protein